MAAAHMTHQPINFSKDRPTMQSVAVFYVHRRPATWASPEAVSGSLCREPYLAELGQTFVEHDGTAEASAVLLQLRLDVAWNTDQNPRSHRYWTREGRYEALVFTGWPPDQLGPIST